MPEEAKNWLKQSDDDYKDAQLLWENHRYGGAILFYQQSVEKILKAYIVQSQKKVPKKTHRIEELIKEAKLDESEIKMVKTIQIDELSKS